jgi:hypothetical protein
MHGKIFRTGFLILICVFLCVPFHGGAQIRSQRSASAAKSQVEAVAITRSPSYVRTKGPDPFLNPLLKRKKSDVDEEVLKSDPPPGIAGMNANDVELLGISMSEDTKTAAFRGTDKRTYFLHEGDRLFDGHLKTIHTNSVLLIRETRLRSGKVLTQEITKRLRN